MLFDISQVFRDRRDNLSSIPYEICVYGETYRFGGATSFMEDRQHYVGYICVSDSVLLYYDGIPSSHTKLTKYERTSIDGDISLICYFPYRDYDRILVSGENNTEKSDTIISDFLLAKALDEVENENVYKRPRGKSFRTSSRNKSCSKVALDIIDTPKTKDDALLPHNDFITLSPPPPLPSNSISSCKSTECSINIDIIEFINGKTNSF